MRKSREINAITFSTMKREVQSLKNELRALRAGHLSTSEVRLPWTQEEKHRHEVNGHAEYDDRGEICVRSSGICEHRPGVRLDVGPEAVQEPEDHKRRFIDTKHQMADILTKGHFTRDE